MDCPHALVAWSQLTWKTVLLCGIVEMDFEEMANQYMCVLGKVKEVPSSCFIEGEEVWKHTCKNKKSVTSVFGHGRGKASFVERKTHKKVVNKTAAVGLVK